MKNNRLHPLNYCPWSGATGYFLQKFVTIKGEALGPAILLRGDQIQEKFWREDIINNEKV